MGLTQCAHRNRPLRYDGRTVVTFCQGDVEYLPITEEVTDLPTLTADGTDRKVANQEEVFARLDAAEAELRAQGEPQPTRRAVRARARAGQNLTSAWWALRHPQAAGATRADEGLA